MKPEAITHPMQQGSHSFLAEYPLHGYGTFPASSLL